MSRSRLMLLAGLAALTVALAVGGYLLGSITAPDQGQAAAEREAMRSDAFAAAHAQALGGAIRRGRKAGEDAGGRSGNRRGARQGGMAGRAAVQKRVHGLKLAAQRRSESESEIGGVDDLAGPGPLAGSGGVLVVGDSLEVLTIPYLKRQLPGVRLTTDAVGGYNSFQIFGLFKHSFDPSQSVVVFDSGTNDNPNYPQILAGRLQAVADQVGNRCLVVPSIHGLKVGGVGNAGKNRVVGSFVASRPGTQSPDWAGAVAAHPELMQSDDLHPVAAGAELRAKLIARGIKRCLQAG